MRALLVLIALSVSSVAAAVPMQLHHQGRLADATGVALTGAHDLTLALYAEASGGAPLWTDTLSTNFEGGVFAVTLGGTGGAALDSAIFDGSVRYLGLRVDSGAELPGRIALVSAPYAVRAGEAEVAHSLEGGLDFAALTGVPSALSDGDDDSLGALACSAGQVAVFDGSAWACGSATPSSVSVDVLTGTLDIARLPVGSGEGTVAAGNHVHAFSDLTGRAAFVQLPVGTDASSVAAGNHTHQLVDLGGDLPLSRTTGDLPIERTTGNLPIERTTGNVPIGRLPVGTASGTVAAGDHTHSALTASIKLTGGSATCNASTTAMHGTLRYASGAFEACTESGWRVFARGGLDGGSQASGAASCKQLLADFPATGSGVYWLDPDGTGLGLGFQTYCDMTTDGGGWTLIMKLTSDATFNWAASYWTTANTLNESDLNFSADANAKYASFNLVAGNELMYYRPGVGAFMKYGYADARTPLSRFTSGATHISTGGGWRPPESHNNTSNAQCSSFTTQGRGLNYSQVCDGNPNYSRARLGEGYEQTGVAHCIWGVGTYNNPCAAPSSGMGSPGGNMRLFVR